MARRAAGGSRPFNKAELRKELERDAKTRHRKALGALREDEAKAKLARKQALELQKQECEAQRQRAVETADKAYRDAVRLEHDARKAKKDHAKRHCQIERAFVREEKDAEVDEKKQRRLEEQRYQRELAGIDRTVRKRLAEQRRRTKPGEHLSQSDDAVRTEIEPRLHALWDRVKSQIRGSALISRAESFAKYVEEHPQEVWEVQERAVEDELRKLAAALPGQPKRRHTPRRPQTQLSTPFGAALTEAGPQEQLKPGRVPRRGRRLPDRELEEAPF
jgi:hypothetical protein